MVKCIITIGKVDALIPKRCYLPRLLFLEKLMAITLFNFTHYKILKMLALIVPYRNREDHLQEFIPYMRSYLPDAKIIIVEQADDKPFNRGILLNIGFLENKADYYCFHDVDHLPVNVSYDCREGVTQLAYSTIQTYNFLGAVTMYDRNTFIKAEGYHNEFFHRAEDNEMMTNLMLKRVYVSQKFGQFKQLPHPRSGPEFIPELWRKAQLPRIVNMLEGCVYEVKSKDDADGYTHLKVQL